MIGNDAGMAGILRRAGHVHRIRKARRPLTPTPAARKLTACVAEVLARHYEN